MNAVQFLHELIKRTKASAVNLRVTEYESGAGLHLFIGEAVFSFDCEIDDFDNPQLMLSEIESYLNEQDRRAAITETNKVVDQLKREGKL